MGNTVLQYVLYLAVTVLLAIPLGGYIAKVMNGEKTFLSVIFRPCEAGVYKLLRVDEKEEMPWKKYAVSVLAFSSIGLVFLILLQRLQGVLGGNPQRLPAVPWALAFNTAASFVTNTNWQAYSGESTLSYLTQALGLTVQNFVSAATGIAVLFALFRGFTRVRQTGLGSFWVDLTRGILYILLPLNLILALCLVGGGVIQNFKGAETSTLLEPVAVAEDGEILENADIDVDANTVSVDGKIVPNAEIVTREFVPMGPAASQIAIKQTGTNGGGYTGVNSAHPLEIRVPIRTFWSCFQFCSFRWRCASVSAAWSKTKSRGARFFLQCFSASAWRSPSLPSTNRAAPARSRRAVRLT